MKIANHPPIPEPLTVSIGEATRLTGLSPSTLRRRHKDGTLPMVRIGNRRLIRLSDLRSLVKAEEVSQ